MGSDTCYSETGLKRLGLTYDRAKLLLLKYRGRPFSKRLGLEVPYSGIVHWAMCDENSTSADANIDSMWQGAGTWAFRMEYRENLSRKQIISKMRQRLRNFGYFQMPHLECDNKLSLKKVGE